MSLIETKKKNVKNDKFLKKIKMTILKNENKKNKRNEKWTVWSRKWTSGIFIADSLLDLWYIQGRVLQQVQIMILLVQQWFY